MIELTGDQGRNNMDICQSCSMPLRSDKDLGTNADGSFNKEYCHFCYQGGKFTDEGITMAQKIDKMVAKAKEMRIPEANARQLAENILPTLKRWRAK
ncbi:MAG: zinc ribbon domain-containing protein [Candidatus Margulisbacteria bacterium]|nr:zinc ribbon domain-containing protein [Candidatus Margulisiibacteriota bacterium]